MNNWIKCSERMPDKDGRYLVFESPYNWIGVSSLREGKWDCKQTTYWCPLPEKPEC